MSPALSGEVRRCEKKTSYGRNNVFFVLKSWIYIVQYCVRYSSFFLVNIFGEFSRSIRSPPFLAIFLCTILYHIRTIIILHRHFKKFYRLYTSASDGLSFNRLMNALLGYGGPTLLIIQSGKSTFGAFTASPWKESKDFYGNHACFLYRLLPERTAVYRPSGGTSKASNRFMYCNSFARSRGYDQQAHGVSNY